MRDPSTLPPELFDSILDQLSPDVSVAPPLLAHDEKWDQLADLYACNLVNRTWHICTLSRLYRAFEFQGHLHSFWRLWKFVRTAIENPNLAALVQCLDLGEYYDAYPIGSSQETTRAEERCRRRENRDMHEMARRVGILEGELTVALRHKDHGPYQILLISILPNLSRLYLSSNGRHSDWRFRLYDMLEVCHLLRSLKVLMLYPLDDFPISETFDERGARHIAHDFFFLPSLQELVLFELDLRIIYAYRAYPDYLRDLYRTSPVKKLTICPRETETICSDGAGSYLQDLLQLPQSLVSLTLCMPLQRTREGDGFGNLITGDQLWRILYHSRDSLECLDIYNADAIEDEEKTQQNTPLGLLCDFKRLKDLRIQPNLLVGGAFGISPAPFRMRDTLPESLRYLTIYDVDEWAPYGYLRQCAEWVEKNSIQCLTLQHREYSVDIKTIMARPSYEEWLDKSYCTLYVLDHPDIEDIALTP